MPPVMGAVAFIMAETIGVPYAEIVKAAIIPAILYFGSAFWMVHLEAGKHGLVGMPRDELPSALAGLQRQWYLHPAAGVPGLSAVRRLHAALRRLGRPGAHGHAHPRPRDRSRGLGDRRPSGSSFWVALGLAARLVPARFGIDARDRCLVAFALHRRHASVVIAAARRRRC